MKILRYIKIQIIIYIFFFNTHLVKGQKKYDKRFSVEFKSIFSTSIFRPSEKYIKGDSIYKINAKLGYGFGSIINLKINKIIGIETGICFTKRNFEVELDNNKNIYLLNFRMISYEIPVKVSTSVQFDKSKRISFSFGPVFTIFPSDVSTYNKNILQQAIRKSWIKVGIDGNVGIEQEIPENGSLYLGIHFQQLFGNSYYTKIGYPGNLFSDAQLKLFLDYFSINLRYYFP